MIYVLQTDGGMTVPGVLSRYPDTGNHIVLRENWPGYRGVPGRNSRSALYFFRFLNFGIGVDEFREQNKCCRAPVSMPYTACYRTTVEGLPVPDGLEASSGRIPSQCRHPESGRALY